MKLPKMNDPGKRITSLWAFVSVDDDGDEGLVAQLFGGTMLPFVASDEHRRDLLLAAARKIHEATGQTISMREFRTVDAQEVV